jgi:adenosylcobinamide kinase/adenosylcobinamide-phosphate guanylyltransferase
VIVDPKPGYFRQHVFNTQPRREGNTVSQSNFLPPTTLVIGGARSGKSAYAERLVEGSGLKPVYLATATTGDDEMSERIRLHRERRGDVWSTIEEPLALTTAIQEHSNNGSVVLVDCLTLWLNNLMALSRDIEQETQELAAMLASLNGPVVFVTNEVGLGIGPDVGPRGGDDLRPPHDPQTKRIKHVGTQKNPCNRGDRLSRCR